MSKINNEGEDCNTVEHNICRPTLKELAYIAWPGTSNRDLLPFYVIDALPGSEIEKLSDYELSEMSRLSDAERDNLTSQECKDIGDRDDARLLRKYCGRHQDEIWEELGFDPSNEPLWFRKKLWELDLTKITPAELEWRRANKWDLGTSENPCPLPADVEIDGRGSPSEQARRLWHRRVWTMTRDEFEQAWTHANDPHVVADDLIFEEYDREENAALLRGAPDSEFKALREEFDSRRQAARKLSGTDLANLIVILAAQEKRVVDARRARVAERRRLARQASRQPPGRCPTDRLNQD